MEKETAEKKRADSDWTPEEPILRVQDLQVIYKSENSIVRAVNGLSFDLACGEVVALVGETGAGKTTTALALMQLLPERTGRVTGGDILFQGASVLDKSSAELRAMRGALISMIFQDPMTSLNPTKTVGAQILESLQIHNYENRSAEELGRRVDELLSLVGIKPGRKHEYPHQFSGGMKQRVVIAMALACKPMVLIADEPTTALDVTIQAQVLALMDELKEKTGTSMIIITHDLGVVAQTCDKAGVMYSGEIVEWGTAQDIFEGAVHHPYTVGLFNSIPDLDDETSTRLNPISGLMPDPTDLPSGCRFHPRCPYRLDICSEKSPAGAYERDGHRIACHLYAREE